MRHLPATVTSGYDREHRFWYAVTLPDGAIERYEKAWQATARAHGWTPPAGLGDVGLRTPLERAPRSETGA